MKLCRNLIIFTLAALYLTGCGTFELEPVTTAGADETVEEWVAEHSTATATTVPTQPPTSTPMLLALDEETAVPTLSSAVPPAETPESVPLDEKTAVPATLPPAPPSDTLDSFKSQLAQALANKDYELLQQLTSDSLPVGIWRSEWQTYTPEQFIQEVSNGGLPAINQVQYVDTLNDEINQLLGVPYASMLGPDVNIVDAVLTTGWGDGSDEAVLLIVEQNQRYHLGAFLYTFGRFADG